MKRLHQLLTFSFLFFSMLAWCQEKKETKILIHTNMGDMKAVLYNDTPRHRDHYIRLIKKKYFDGTLFYRVVKGYVIQGGSADSRNASPGTKVGYGNNAMQLYPEFRKRYFHKRGALCAPRQGNEINPQQKSDASQFFIVHGQLFRKGQLDTMEMQKNIPIKNRAYSLFYTPKKEHLANLKHLSPMMYKRELKKIKRKIDSTLNASPNKLIFTEEQRVAYTTIGGTPNLDGDYTIFGEVYEGLDVIDKIANLKVNGFKRPNKDVKMKVTIINE